MPARAAAGDPEAVGIYAILRGVMPHVADAAVHVVDNLHDRGLRLRDVADGEHRIAGPQKRSGQPRGRFARPFRPPPATHKKRHAQAVPPAGGRTQDIHGQRRAVAVTVDEAIGPFERWMQIQPQRPGRGARHQEHHREDNAGGPKHFAQLGRHGLRTGAMRATRDTTSGDESAPTRAPHSRAAWRASTAARPPYPCRCARECS